MDPRDSWPPVDRLDGLVAIFPFVVFALVSVALVLLWAPDPRWGFVIVLPFAFMISLTWLAFTRAQ